MGDRRFGPYRLENLLGNGGTGQVWRAHDTRTDRTVALKLLARELAADDTFRQRFQREARLAARLREPHVVPIHTFGEQDGQLFIDMAYVEGSDLGKLLRNDGRLPPATAVDVVTQIAAALDEAHKRGLVHRDVKPANIIVMPSGFAYLIDFGTVQQIGQSTLTGASLIIGTPGYMAPERFTGSADCRSDIYSLGCVLYETLTGRRPFPEPDAVGQMHAHLHTDPPHVTDCDPSFPAELDDVIVRALAKDPAQRFETAGEFAAAAHVALTRAAASATAPVPVIPATRTLTETVAPVDAAADGSLGAGPAAVVMPLRPGGGGAESPRAPVFPRRFAAAVALAALLVGGGSGWAVWQSDRHSPPAPAPSQQPVAPVATSTPAPITTAAPRQSTGGATSYVKPPPAPRLSASPSPEPSAESSELPPPASTAAPAPQNSAVLPPTSAALPPQATAAPTTTALPFPVPEGFTPPGAALPRADKPDVKSESETGEPGTPTQPPP
ncbi:serine/threonine protein kinase [Nocardia yunnanensis]|uniref:non-specific serine/threonine protein kinase n=1 Tax=Nocardia yunnanensis TaxID=2382165 RepID=A0A386ZBM0_9NOCA|nr:serine/threonine-protein kinase [Nocardia yunnanensis]AYF75020.1 serine/threonine protein kinase [Nocardia yunnanensis]